MHCKKNVHTNQSPGARLADATLTRIREAQDVAKKQAADRNEPITIKKYANRRLYNTATSSYVTLDHLCQMVKDGVDFVVYDAKSGKDITHPVLTQIIVEEESKGQNLLPITFLRQLIGFYGDSLQWMVPQYLEHTMASFATNQDRVRKSMQDAFGGVFPLGNLEDIGKQNMALIESAMKMFSPYVPTPADGPQKARNNEGKASNADALAELRKQVNQLQKQLDALSPDQRKT